MSSGSQNLVKEVAGLVFTNPVGMPYTIKKGHFSLFQGVPKAGFLTLTPPKESVLGWIRGLDKEQFGASRLAVDLSADIVRNFSLIYDFADFIIIDPDNNLGIGASDISDTHDLLDELVSLRLCYERYTPVFLRLPRETNADELKSLLGACQMNGLDGVVLAGMASLAQVREITLGRVPLICPVHTTEEGLQALENGACLVEFSSSKGISKLLNSLEKKQLV